MSRSPVARLDALEPWSHHWFGHWGVHRPSWNIYCGDSRTVLDTLAGDLYSCVITSPPYFWQRDYDVPGQIGLEATIAGYVTAICDVMDGVHRVLNSKGVLFLNLGDTYYSGKGKPKGKDPKHNGRRLSVLRLVDASGLGKPKKSLLGMPWRVALEMIDRGWILRTPIIWQRAKAIPEANVLDRPWRTYEHVFLFSKSGSYRFSRAELKKASVEDVWTVESRPKAGRGHPAAFSLELVRRCLSIGNPSKGTVLDPFAGSGTVLRAALELGCNADGIDLNQKYCQAAAADLKRP